MQRLGFSQVHSECDKFPATLSSQWHAHKCQQACFILHPYVATGTAHRSEGRGQAEGCGGSGGCSLQSPQLSQRHPGQIRTWDMEGPSHLQKKKKPCGEQCLCTRVFVARDTVGEGWSRTCSLAPLLHTVDWATAAFACLPSFQNIKYFYMKICISSIHFYTDSLCWLCCTNNLPTFEDWKWGFQC